MGRVTNALVQIEQQQKDDVEDEVSGVVSSFKPDDMPDDVWVLVQENGRLATERLNQILSSVKFARMRPADQAKLIQLAQVRAYGAPKTNNARDNKRRGSGRDITASSLNSLVHRATLPEYKQQVTFDDD